LTGDSGIRALQRLGLKYRHETFGKGMLLKGSFRLRGQGGLGTGFLSIALLILYRAGLRVLWHSITTGGVKLTPPLLMIIVVVVCII